MSASWHDQKGALISLGFQRFIHCSFILNYFFHGLFIDFYGLFNDFVDFFIDCSLIFIDFSLMFIDFWTFLEQKPLKTIVKHS